MATSIYKTILKRLTCLNAIEEQVSDPSPRYENIVDIIKRSENGKVSSLLQEAVKNYMDSMCNCNNASKYYWQPLSLAVEFNAIDSGLSNSCIINNYINRVLPYTEDMNMVKWAIDRYNLTEDQKNTLSEAVNKYIVADRISTNHNKISNRFNIEREYAKYRSMGLKFLVESIGGMIDTYNVNDYQKMNITIEESYYFLNKYNVNYDSYDLAKYTLEYYLTRSPYTSDAELNKYRRVINESYVIDQEDIKKFNEGYSSDVDNIKNTVSSYILSNTKTIDKLSESVKDILESTSKEDIKYNSDSIIYLSWDLAKNKIFESDKELYNVPKIIPDSINTKLEEQVDSYNKEDIDGIINMIESVKKYIYDSGNSNIDYSKSAVEFIRESLDPALESLNNIRQLVYNKSNIDTINYLESSDAVLNLDKYKDSKYHNLVSEAFALDKFLNIKESRVNLMDKITNVLLSESISEYKDNIMSYIGSDNKADITIRHYSFKESKLDEVSEFLNSVCNEFNDILASKSASSRSYYIINPYNAEIRIKDPTNIAIGESIQEGVIYDVDPGFCLYINDIAESADVCSALSDVKSIERFIGMMNKSDSFTYEQFTLALEAMSILGVDAELVSLFGSKFNDYQFEQTIKNGTVNESYSGLARQENIVANTVSNWEAVEEVSLEDKIEAYNYLSAIFEYSYPEYNDDDDEDEDDDEDTKDEKKDDKKEEDKKEPNNKEAFDKLRDENKNMAKEVEKEVLDKAPGDGKKPYKAKFDINDIKLALLGLKEKVKNFDTKQKEVSKNLDNATRSLVKGIKDALVSDRREAIIKGSVIPSFSRCIKAAVILAAVAHFSLPAAAIGAVGALALSKKLTDRERLLLLDEIETEIEVCDKELAIADSNNQINKYRALLQYKKDLQRQYQRIKYNIRIGKDILPGSASGMRSSDND